MTRTLTGLLRLTVISTLLGVIGVAAAPGSGVFLVGFPNADSSQADSFELLGGASGGRWQTHETLKVSPARYDLWNLQGKTGSVTGATKVSFQEPCPDTYSVRVKPAPQSPTWLMAVNAPWNPRPRGVTVLPNSNATYQGTLRAFLEQKGLKNPKLKLTSLIRTDLDGDGSDEVILVATNLTGEGGPSSATFPPARGTKGDYSLMLVRKIVNGKLQTFELGSDVFLKSTTDEDITNGTQNNPDLFALVNVLDLNGDGKMEIIMHNAIYEDYGIFVMEWDGKKFQQRLVTGCGA